MMLRRPPTKPPRTFTASLVINDENDADDVTAHDMTLKNVLSDKDLTKLIRSASVTKMDSDNVTPHDVTKHAALSDVSKHDVSKKILKPSISVTSDDSSDAEERQIVSKNNSSRFKAETDVPAYQATVTEIQDRVGAKPDVDQSVRGAERVRDDVPELSVTGIDVVKNKVKSKDVVIKNPRALTKETNKKLPESKSISEPAKTQEVDLNEMPNFRMAHAAMVSVHGPAKKSSKKLREAGSQDVPEPEIVVEEDLNVDLNLFSPDYNSPARMAVPSSGPNKKLASHKKKKKQEVLIPGKLTAEEEKILEEAQREKERKRRDEEEDRRRKREEIQRKKEEERKREKEKIEKSRKLKTEISRPKSAKSGGDKSGGVEKTENLRHQLKNLMSQQISDDVTTAGVVRPTTSTTTVHLDIESDNDSLVMPRRRSRKSSSLSRSSSTSSIEILDDRKQILTTAAAAATSARLVKDSGNGIYLYSSRLG